MSRSSGEDEFPFSFTCRRSGNCCSRPGGFVRVDDGELLEIASYLGMSPAGARARFLDAGDMLKSGLGNRCVFLEDGVAASCSIYPARPAKCRTWPFWPELLEPGALAEAVRLCPGITPERSLA